VRTWQVVLSELHLHPRCPAITRKECRAGSTRALGKIEQCMLFVEAMTHVMDPPRAVPMLLYLCFFHTPPRPADLSSPPPPHSMSITRQRACDARCTLKELMHVASPVAPLPGSQRRPAQDRAQLPSLNGLLPATKSPRSLVPGPRSAHLLAEEGLADGHVDALLGLVLPLANPLLRAHRLVVAAALKGGRKRGVREG
jgi:hypothetical protein